MKVRVWLLTRERSAWIAAAETFALTVLLTLAVESMLLRVVAFALAAHLGYTAMTALPMGSVPGRPAGARARRNLDLRAQVVSFLREVRRVDDYAQRAAVSGLAVQEVTVNLKAGEQRLMTAAARVAKVAGRLPAEENTDFEAEAELA